MRDSTRISPYNLSGPYNIIKLLQKLKDLCSVFAGSVLANLTPGLVGLVFLLTLLLLCGCFLIPYGRKYCFLIPGQIFDKCVRKHNLSRIPTESVQSLVNNGNGTATTSL